MQGNCQERLRNPSSEQAPPSRARHATRRAAARSTGSRSRMSASRRRPAVRQQFGRPSGQGGWAGFRLTEWRLRTCTGPPVSSLATATTPRSVLMSGRTQVGLFQKGAQGRGVVAQSARRNGAEPSSQGFSPRHTEYEGLCPGRMRTQRVGYKEAPGRSRGLSGSVRSRCPHRARQCAW